MAVTVKDVLEAPVLCDAQVVAGAAGVAEREVRSTTVIEWRGADFARANEFVLTTGLGCDAQRFEHFARQVADADAAALCVSLHASGELTEIPSAVRKLADERAFPVISVPWAVRFAEIMMSITDRLIQNQYAAVLNDPDTLVGSFTNVLLGGSGLTAIADALAGITRRPVLILDPEFRWVARSANAQAALAPALASWDDTLAQVDAEGLQELRQTFGDDTARQIDGIPQLGLGPGVVTAAIARHRPVGYVYVAHQDDLSLTPSLEFRAVAHAGMAVAMEMLRLRAAAEAESRARGNFLWSLAAGVGGARYEVATNAVLLGYDLRTEYEVAVGAGAGDELERREADAEALVRRLQGGRGRHPVAARQADQVLLLAPVDEDGAARLLDAAREGSRSTWGIADGAFTLLGLDHGYRQALQALEIGEMINGRGQVTEARALGAYLMLDVLAQSDAAVRSARGLLEPILEYDRASARDLLTTLEVFLRENGNTSAAARALFLNRHSLRYRLHKIEQLTGRSLELYQDRFLLDMSLKVLHLVERRANRSIAVAQPGRPASLDNARD